MNKSMNVNHRTTFGKGPTDRKLSQMRGEGRFDQLRHIGGSWYLLVKGQWCLAAPGPSGETVDDLAHHDTVTVYAQVG